MMHVEGQNELALLHNLAILYLGLAAAPDEELGRAELREVNARLRRWRPDKDPACIDHVMRDVALSYHEEAAGESFTRIVSDLGQHLTKDRRTEILYDLAGFARADGGVRDAEQDVIRRVARVWRLEEQQGMSGRATCPPARPPASRPRHTEATRRADRCP